MPQPLTLWAGAVVAAFIGARKRPGLARRAPFTGITTQLVRRAPLPSTLVRRLATDRMMADAATLGMGPDGALDAARRRLIGSGVGLVLAVVGLPLDRSLVALGMVSSLVGYASPSLALARRARRRRDLIVADLPDLIDVVSLCADAGMPLEPALRMVSVHLAGPCAREIAATLGEMDLGVPRHVAYRQLARRVGAPEIQGLVGALIQADDLGTPVAAVLVRQADLLRAGRQQRVRDQAARAAPLVQLVVAMVMVPGALLVIVGVMVLHLIEQLGPFLGTMP